MPQMNLLPILIAFRRRRRRRLSSLANIVLLHPPPLHFRVSLHHPPPQSGLPHCSSRAWVILEPFPPEHYFRSDHFFFICKHALLLTFPFPPMHFTQVIFLPGRGAKSDTAALLKLESSSTFFLFCCDRSWSPSGRGYLSVIVWRDLNKMDCNTPTRTLSPRPPFPLFDSALFFFSLSFETFLP